MTKKSFLDVQQTTFNLKIFCFFMVSRNTIEKKTLLKLLIKTKQLILI